MTYDELQDEWDRRVGPEAAARHKHWRENSERTRMLSLHRVKIGMTEQQVADKIGWPLDKVLAFELATDDDITPQDIEAYMQGLITDEPHD